MMVNFSLGAAVNLVSPDAFPFIQELTYCENNFVEEQEEKPMIRQEKSETKSEVESSSDFFLVLLEKKKERREGRHIQTCKILLQEPYNNFSIDTKC